MKNNWKVMKIEEIGEVVNGGTPSTKKEEYWGGDIAWITPKDLSNYNKKFISKGERSITQLGLQNSSAKIVPPKTVLLTSRAPIGYLAIAQNELSTNQGFKSIICNENIINYNFLYYLLKTRIEEMISIAGGSTFKEISTRAFKSLEIKVPPLKEQIKISNILSIIDSKIELNNQINEKLEETAKAIYNEWFVNFNFPDENGLPYKDNGGEFYETKLGEIPICWKIEKLGDGDLTTIIGSGIDDFDGEKIYLATADVVDTNIINSDTFISMENRPSRANIQPKPNTVWFARMKNSRKLILVDYYAKQIINNYIFSTGFAGLECKNNSLYYIWNIICSEDFDAIKNNLCNGTTMQAINNANIKQIDIIVPDSKTLVRFNQLVLPIYRKIYIKNIENMSLSDLRETLINKLMSGQIDVDKLNIDWDKLDKTLKEVE